MEEARILLRTCGMLIAAMLSLPALATTLFVVGDTGDCRWEGAGLVSAAMRRQPDWQQAILVEVGDLAYPVATKERLAECHEPHFGMFKRRLAVPGNHDSRDPGSAGFYSLFPDPLPRSAGIDDLWQIWLLDTSLRNDAWRRQVEWLGQARARASGVCVIAAWHYPRRSSGKHGDNAFTEPLWQGVAGVATFTLHGHDHHYEALPPLDKDGQAATRGTRTFISGNGGAGLYEPGTLRPASKAVFGQWGFLRIDLDRKRYAWKAFNTAGEVIDAGEDSCLDAAAPALK
jgi:hypothetical protein